MPRRATTEAVVYIVDDDRSVGKALHRLVESVGLRAATFETPEALLRHGDLDDCICLLLDVQLPGMDGFELYDRIRGSRDAAPVIFMTARLGRNTRERAAAVDAVDCLEKPFDDDALLAALETALERVDPPRSA